MKNNIVEKVKEFFMDIKDGMMDVKNMLLESNYTPFIRPVVVLLVIGFLLNFVNGKAQDGVRKVRNTVEAQRAEVENEKEYKTSKETYQGFVKNLPPTEQKNEWLLRELISIFSANEIQTSRTGRHVLEESGFFTLSSVSFEVELDYNQLGKLVASIENFEKYMRISELIVNRADGSLGTLRVSIRVHTIFVNDKK